MNSGTIALIEISAASVGSARASAITMPPSTAVTASGRRSLGPTDVPSSRGRVEVEQQLHEHDQRRRCRRRRARAAEGVTTRLPGLPLQACEPAFTASTLASPHSGWRSTHRMIGANSANTAATRATIHVRLDGPCHSSAMK